VHHAKLQQHAARSQHPNLHAQRVAQYAARLWLAPAAKLIDDLHYQNYHVPALRYQERVRRDDGSNCSTPVGHVYAESDYLDAQEQFNYTQPHWQLQEHMATHELQQLLAINLAVRTALNNKSIKLAQLRAALTPQQLQEFQVSLAEMNEPSESMYGQGMPDVLHDYNNKLRAADFAWARYEALPTAVRYGAKRTPGASGLQESRAISAYEDALECLGEIFSSAQRGDYGVAMLGELTTWMDRAVDFNAGTNCVLDTNPEAMPRVRGSRSRYALDSGLPKLSKRIKHQLCAVKALLAAACELAFVVPPKQEIMLTPQQQHELKSKLQGLLGKMRAA